MKFGFMSLDFRRMPLEFSFKMAKEYGFDGVEIFCARRHVHLPSFTWADAQVINEYKKKYGIEVPMLTPYTLGMDVCVCSEDSAEVEDGIKLLKKGVDAAEMIEAPRMLVTADHPGYSRDDRTVWNTFTASMKEVCSYAEKKGIKVVIEPVTPMESPVITTSGDCLRLMEDVQSNALYAMLDVVPPVIMHEPFSRYFELLGDRMDYIHICNTDGVTDAHLRFSEGVLPVHDAINVFKRHNYNGYVTTELYSENYRDPELLLANTARELKQIREDLGI